MIINVIDFEQLPLYLGYISRILLNRILFVLYLIRINLIIKSGKTELYFMKLILQSPKKALNKSFLKQRPLRSEMEVFKKNLSSLLDKINIINQRPKDESEEHLKNDIRDFLRDTYYKETNAINTKEKSDLVIHVDKTVDSKVGIIIEAKRPTNFNEMISDGKPNSKALQELVLYYLRERLDLGNIDIKYLVITNIHEWYIFEASWFEKTFYKNKSFLKEYEEWRDGKKVTKETSLFYNEIAKPFIDKIQDEVPSTYFNILKYQEQLTNENKEDDKVLIALYKVLSPQHLLKVPFSNDSNELNEKFYKELLHIIGLEETKVNGKTIIRRKEQNRDSASLIEKAIDELKTEGLHKVPDIKSFGETKEEQYFNIALELCITWINRILFLKLLEGQLVSYHKGDRSFRFLNSEMIHDFDELFKLFHKVLAVNVQDRSTTIQAKYSRIPYLNSSLFEISDLEDVTLKINSLDNSDKLDLIASTILKEEKKRNVSLNTLDYLFKFLDSYDFASEGSEDIEDDNKTLINASVLGKVFEKINGYKDGSIYTPGFITMYMCKNSIREAVLKKFKEEYKWNVEKFEDLRNYIVDRRGRNDILEFNKLINSLHICDPAVGSGHFLVSALNELIAVKSELGILCDDTGTRLTDFEIENSNDELIVTDVNGDIFQYQFINGKPANKEAQRFQKSLFNEKQNLIENCLFGVDINPNSVKICRLRLWIELLKNAYYKEETGFAELETLPNIDINIKCGNSLISRFTLDIDISKALKGSKYDVIAYRKFVGDYKKERNRDSKKELQKIIDGIKSDFKTYVGRNSKEQKRLDKLSSELFNKYKADKLFSQKLTPAQLKDKAKLQKQVDDQKALIEEINNNVIYKNAFEWRFEFPEILSNDGDFIGFDVIIGNPPYVRRTDLSEIQKKEYEKRFDSATKQYDLYLLFIENSMKLLKTDSILAFINPKFFVNDYGIGLRKHLLDNYHLETVIDLSPFNVFGDISTYPCIYFIRNSSEEKKIVHFYPSESVVIKDDLKVTACVEYDFSEFNENKDFIYNFSSNRKLDSIISKLDECNSIGDYYSCQRGLPNTKVTFSERGNILGLKSVKVKKYQVIKEFEKLSINGDEDKTKELFKSDLILLPRTVLKLQAAYKSSKDKFVILDRIYFLTPIKGTKINSLYVLSLLNSTLMNFWFDYKFSSTKVRGGYFDLRGTQITQIPVKAISEKEQQPFVELASEIIAQKEKGSSTNALESKLDNMIYKLFDISKDDIKTIEGK